MVRNPASRTMCPGVRGPALGPESQFHIQELESCNQNPDKQIQFSKAGVSKRMESVFLSRDVTLVTSGGWGVREM